MSRIIIENRSNLTDVDAVEHAQAVMREGRISGAEGKEQYCYLTTFNNDIHVSAFLNKSSDRLVVTGEVQS